jgi:hypothetical protein
MCLTAMITDPRSQESCATAAIFIWLINKSAILGDVLRIVFDCCCAA